MTLGSRFWSKVDKSGGPDACWLWTAATGGGEDGDYGQFAHDVSRYPHRLAWIEVNGAGR